MEEKEENNNGSCREAEGILSMNCDRGAELLAADCCGFWKCTWLQEWSLPWRKFHKVLTKDIKVPHLPQEFTEMQIARSFEHGEMITAYLPSIQALYKLLTRLLLLITVRNYLWEEIYFQSHPVQLFSWAVRLDFETETPVKNRVPSGRGKDLFVSSFCGSWSKVKVLRKDWNSVGALLKGVVSLLFGKILA